MKRALISVFDKTGIEEFARILNKELGWEIVSTGGTAVKLRTAGINVKDIAEVTGFPECLDGRVKTLHPKIEGGILGRRNIPLHLEQMEKLGMQPIDMVVCNLYPFKETLLSDKISHEVIIENIDIGGPTMIRAAAKNYESVIVITDIKDYDTVIEELKKNDDCSLETKTRLAAKVFAHTAHYDALIAAYFRSITDIDAPTLTLTYEKIRKLRYGENPHQAAAVYKEVGRNKSGILTEARQIHGKELSFNNISDADGALELLKEFDDTPTIVAVKHANPCGVACATTISEAFEKAYNADPVSIFGGIIASNTEIDEKTAEHMSKIFLEIIIAPSYSSEALRILEKKKNIRLLELEHIMKRNENCQKIKTISGGLLLQNCDDILLNTENALNVVTHKKPTAEELRDLLFAWKVVKHTKSNAIVIAQNLITTGIGPGQVSRIWALENAIRQGGEKIKGSVLASDAFFPFPDCVEVAHKAGITAIIQPGGSIRDAESVDAANKYGIAMIFTGIRHFKH